MRASCFVCPHEPALPKVRVAYSGASSQATLLQALKWLVFSAKFLFCTHSLREAFSSTFKNAPGLLCTSYLVRMGGLAVRLACIHSRLSPRTLQW